MANKAKTRTTSKKAAKSTSPNVVFGEQVYTRSVTFEYIPFNKKWAAVRERVINSYKHMGAELTGTGSSVPRAKLEIPHEEPWEEVTEYVLPLKGIRETLSTWRSPNVRNNDAVWVDPTIREMIRVTPDHEKDQMWDHIFQLMEDKDTNLVRKDIYTLISEGGNPRHIVRMDPDWACWQDLDRKPLPETLMFYLSGEHFDLKKAFKILSNRSDVVVWQNGWQCHRHYQTVTVKSAIGKRYAGDPGTIKFDWTPNVQDFNTALRGAKSNVDLNELLSEVIIGSDILGLFAAANRNKDAQAYVKRLRELHK